MNGYEPIVALQKRNVSKNVLQTPTMECSNRWNPDKGQSLKLIANSQLDINQRTTINKTQFRDQGRTTNGEVEFSITTKEGARVEGIFLRIQGCSCMAYKDLKGIPPKLIEHRIEFDTTIPLAHQTKFRLNPNYATIMKEDIDKLLAIGFIQPMEKDAWLSLIVVVPKKNEKLRICVDFKMFNVATKKDPFPLPFTHEVCNHNQMSQQWWRIQPQMGLFWTFSLFHRL